jgi:glucosamine--fructose-6-phosphate aminotransferase (isomerizing)
VITAFAGKLDLSQALTIGVSQSGKAEDVLAVLNHAKKQGGLTVSLTNYPNSPMAKAADIHLWLNAGEEQSVAATKTFLSQMYVLALLVEALSQDSALGHQLVMVPHFLEEVLHAKFAIARHTDSLVKANDCYVLGRGFMTAIAHEFALKLQETTYIKALGYSTSDFHHGPFAMVDETTTVILLAPDDATMTDSVEMVKKLKAAKARIIAITDTGELPVEDKILLPKVHPAIAPFLFIMAGQMFALDLSLKRGNDPDKPRGLNKVTITK